jgi:acyl-CoA thioesterase
MRTNRYTTSRCALQSPKRTSPIAQQLVQARRHLIDALFATDAPIEAWMRQYATALDNTLRALYQRAWVQASQEVPAPRETPACRVCHRRLR